MKENLEKLELKHLAPYLPYELKGNYEVSEVVPSAKFELRNKELRTDNIDFFLNYAKPIFRPLSDLARKVEINGEKFYPLAKLLEYQETNYFSECEHLKLVKFNENCLISIDHNYYDLLKKEDFIVKFISATSNGESIMTFTYDPDSRRFAMRDEYLKKPLGIAYQLDMFQKLFEWHFDVFGLIEKGLAIDINTLNK